MSPREEPERAVSGPLNDDGPVTAADLGFDEPGPLVDRPDVVSGVAKGGPVNLPSGLDGLGGIVKDVHVLRDAATAEGLVQGRAASYVAIAGSNTIRG